LNLRSLASAYLVLVVLLAIGADWISPFPYAIQFREQINARPSLRFPLGTDALGRDRFSRLLHGTRVSVALAPAAALLSVLAALLIGVPSGYLGGWYARASSALINTFLSLPWLFALLTVRALLPLNIGPWASVLVTFWLLGLLGWGAGARVIHARVADVCRSEFILQARASGCAESRLMLIHILPNLRPILAAQFWTLVPVYILTEANLGMLGLGVTEPLPSWGSLLAELESYSGISEAPWRLAPALLLVAFVGCLHFVIAAKEEPWTSPDAQRY